MKDIEKFKGVFPAFYTAYDAKGDVSPERVRALAQYYMAKGVKGLYITGSSGECVYLNVDERKTVMRNVMEVAKGKMTIIAHVGACSTRDSVKLACYAKELGCDAIASIPPIYFAIPEDAIADYWTAMIEAADLPFVIYNIPQTTGINVGKSLFAKMLKNPHLLGIKNTSLPVMDMLAFKTMGGNDRIVFNGPDEQFAAGRLMGADSGIGGTYGVMPELFMKIDCFVRKGDFKNASELQKTTTNLIFDILGAGGMLAVVKEILRLRGMDIGTARRPLPQLTSEQKAAIPALERKITATIKQWCEDVPS